MKNLVSVKTLLPKIRAFGLKSGLMYDPSIPQDAAAERMVDGADYTPAEEKFVKKNFNKIYKEVKNKLF